MPGKSGLGSPRGLSKPGPRAGAQRCIQETRQAGQHQLPMGQRRCGCHSIPQDRQPPQKAGPASPLASSERPVLTAGLSLKAFPVWGGRAWRPHRSWAPGGGHTWAEIWARAKGRWLRGQSPCPALVWGVHSCVCSPVRRAGLVTPGGGTRGATGLADSLRLLRPQPRAARPTSPAPGPGGPGLPVCSAWAGSIPACCPPSRQWLEGALRENEPGACLLFLVGTKKDLLVSRAGRPRGTRGGG